MNEKNKLYSELELLYEAIKVAKEGLNAIKEHDILAEKTLIEIDKIVEKKVKSEKKEKVEEPKEEEIVMEAETVEL